MVKVKLDYTGAELMLEIFSHAKEGKVSPSDIIDELINTKVMDYFVEHYNLPQGSNANINKEDVREVFQNLWNEEYKSKKEFINTIFDDYRKKLFQIEYYSEKIKEINMNYDNNIVEEKLNKYLPSDIDFSSTVYIIFTGLSGGYFNEKDITLDLSFISQEVNMISNVIAHELHHIGYNGIYENIIGSRNLQGSKLLIAELISGLIGEGIAYYCVGGIPEIGQKGYEDFQKEMIKEKEYFQDINDTFNKLLVEEMNFDNFMKWVHGHMSQRFGAINYIGIRTIETIHKVFGLDGIIEVILNPDVFLLKYNLAAEELNNDNENNYIFDRELVRSIIGFYK